MITRHCEELRKSDEAISEIASATFGPLPCNDGKIL